jgi:TonB-linked SusC/RagA family outer membrane protein
MLKKLLIISLMYLFAVSIAFAQSSTVTGIVTDANTGDPVPQVNVFIVELQTGDATDFDGQYSISNVQNGTYIFRISSVGYRTLEQQVTVDASNTNFDFQLRPDVRLLDDVVVTAFGVSREQRSLGYAVQDLNAEKLARVQQDNIVGALAGKIAGVQVTGSTNFGGSERIRIRGANGLSDGQPLFVVDGTPISNQSFIVSGGGSARGRDLGNLASDINLQNVESVSVLKGAAAAALYGNRAADGVILITTKNAAMGQEQPLQVEFNHNTTFESVYILPEYQNEYAGGYTQDFNQYTDPRDGQTYNGLNYAADESWGPRIDGQMYRPWWSWFNHDFTGDGQNDYGTEIPLTSQSNNVRDFFDTGVRMSNSLAITGGSSTASFRAGLTNTNNNGVVPNSELDRTSLSFNGALSHSDRFRSTIAFNYVNTSVEGRPATGYSAVQGNAFQQMNQWFQRQLDMDKLRQYRAADGTLMSWNIRSSNDLRPLYWDSPFFSILENVQTDDRDRIYGNYQLSYNFRENIQLQGKLHLDSYSFNVQDRIATGGLEQDWFYTAQRSRREVNYEAGIRYEEDFKDFSFNGYFGGNILTQRFSSLQQQTQGGLSVPNFFNIDASIDRPSVSNFNEQKEVRSLFGTATIGFKDIVYVDLTGRNDWSSALPSDNNSYFYYGLSGSLVFTEFDFFANQNILTFGKLRASVAQVGNDLEPFRVFQTFNSGTPFGSMPSQSIPSTLANPDLKPAISSDYEFGVDLRFLDGRLRTDINYYNSVRENEILQLDVPGSSGYSSSLINAGEFETTGWEIAVGATPVQTADWNVDVDVNWSTSKSVVNELADGITTRLLESAFFGIQLFAVEGEEWGQAITSGSYGGYLLDEQGRRVVNSDGTYALESNKPLGNILPDWNGGFNLGVSFRNISMGAFVEFQKGGKFYSLSRMFGTYSGLTQNTVGNNSLGNPLRDPVVNNSGDSGLSSVPLSQAAPNSGGVLIEGVDTEGNEVAYLREASLWGVDMFYNKEAWLEDASYIKLREIRLTYDIPVDLLQRTPLSRASVSLDLRNPLLIYSSTSGVDPSAIQNNANGFGFWEGGGLPGTRSVGFNVNLNF